MSKSDEMRQELFTKIMALSEKELAEVIRRVIEEAIPLPAELKRIGDHLE